MRVEGIGGVILVYPDGLTKEEGEERVVKRSQKFLDELFTRKDGEALGVEFVTTVTRKPAEIKEAEKAKETI